MDVLMQLKDMFLAFWLKYYIYFTLLVMGISCYRFVKENKSINKRKLIVGTVLMLVFLSGVNFYLFTR